MKSGLLRNAVPTFLFKLWGQLGDLLMHSMAIDARHRDKNGEISRKHGNTLMRTLRKTYGSGFAAGCADHEKLSDVLPKLDETSLSHLIRDNEAGYLHQICQAA